MNNILLATQNEHKKEEILAILPQGIQLRTFNDFNFEGDIEETGSTFEENALIKAQFGFDLTHLPTISDDSGLVIEALNGEPGVYSARYSDTGASEDNIKKVLDKMNGATNRKAYFISVLCWIDGKEIKYFEGRVHGTIATELSGQKGFGYDPIFIPDGYDKSFAEFTPEDKNKISHRALALKEFQQFILNK